MGSEARNYQVREVGVIGGGDRKVTFPYHPGYIQQHGVSGRQPVAGPTSGLSPNCD